MKNPEAPDVFMTHTLRPVRILTLLALFAGTAGAAETSFEDTFAQDDSANYEIQGGEWAYDAANKAFTMGKYLGTPNETVSALRNDIELPKAFTLEAEYTADGNDSSVGLIIKDPATGHYAFASLTLKKNEGDGWWVIAWIVYSYPEKQWGYLRQTKKLVADIGDPVFTLQLTRPPGSDTLEFIVFNSAIGTLETSLAPGTTGDEGNELTLAWTDTLNSFTKAGLSGYDSKGSWSRVKLTDLTK